MVHKSIPISVQFYSFILYFLVNPIISHTSYKTISSPMIIVVTISTFNTPDKVLIVGLHLAQDIISRQYGFIHVLSTLHVGSTFEVWLINSDTPK